MCIRDRPYTVPFVFIMTSDRTDANPPEELSIRLFSSFLQVAQTDNGCRKWEWLFAGHVFKHNPQSTHWFSVTKGKRCPSFPLVTVMHCFVHLSIHAMHPLQLDIVLIFIIDCQWIVWISPIHFLFFDLLWYSQKTFEELKYTLFGLLVCSLSIRIMSLDFPYVNSLYAYVCWKQIQAYWTGWKMLFREMN